MDLISGKEIKQEEPPDDVEHSPETSEVLHIKKETDYLIEIEISENQNFVESMLSEHLGAVSTTSVTSTVTEMVELPKDVDRSLRVVKTETCEVLQIKKDPDDVKTEFSENQNFAESMLSEHLGAVSTTSVTSASQTKGCKGKNSTNKAITKIERFECDTCGQRFEWLYHLKLHIMTKHSEKKPYKCDVCDYRCRKNKYLKRHMEIHTGDKPYQCDVCDYRCGNRSYLKKHMKIHTGEKPYKCSVCDYRCSGRSNLKQHIMNIHTGEKPYKCDVCDYRCGRRCDLKRHMNIHTGEKPYKCDVCDYRCGNRSYLKIHNMKIHTGEKP